MTDSLTFYYIIFAIVLLHLVLGFAWVIYKFMRKGGGTPEQTENKVDKE
jgi:flagellar biogenesis protein FliO